MKKADTIFQKSNALIMALILIILAIIGYECYSVTHIELKTQEATLSTVYDKIDTTALVVREEQTISNSGADVVVPCLNDGDKINVKGNVAMCFSNTENATAYSKYNELVGQLEYYNNLQSQTVGHATDLEKINDDIDQKLLDYAYSLSKNDAEKASSDLNSALVRRQMIIGEKVDLASKINAIADEMKQYSGVKPNSFITTDKSGVFSNYTDGFENLVDYQNIKDTTLKNFESYMKAVKDKKDTSSNLGKLVTGYEWYMLSKVSADDVKGLENGDTVKVVLKNNGGIVLKMEIVSGAELDFGEKESLLILKANEMDAQLAQIRCEDIEIRKDSFEGFKVPYEAVHVVDGKKGVYVLIASEIKFREIETVYSDDEYFWVKYDTENSKALHLYDQIIIRGKDLEDGKVYT